MYRRGRGGLNSHPLGIPGTIMHAAMMRQHQNRVEESVGSSDFVGGDDSESMQSDQVDTEMMVDQDEPDLSLIGEVFSVAPANDTNSDRMEDVVERVARRMQAPRSTVHATTQQTRTTQPPKGDYRHKLQLRRQKNASKSTPFNSVPGPQHNQVQRLKSQYRFGDATIDYGKEMEEINRRRNDTSNADNIMRTDNPSYPNTTGYTRGQIESIKEGKGDLRIQPYNETWSQAVDKIEQVIQRTPIYHFLTLVASISQLPLARFYVIIPPQGGGAVNPATKAAVEKRLSALSGLHEETDKLANTETDVITEIADLERRMFDTVNREVDKDAEINQFDKDKNQELSKFDAFVTRRKKENPTPGVVSNEQMQLWLSYKLVSSLETENYIGEFIRNQRTMHKDDVAAVLQMDTTRVKDILAAGRYNSAIFLPGTACFLSIMTFIEELFSKAVDYNDIPKSAGECHEIVDIYWTQDTDVQFLQCIFPWYTNEDDTTFDAKTVQMARQMIDHAKQVFMVWLVLAKNIELFISKSIPLDNMDNEPSEEQDEDSSTTDKDLSIDKTEILHIRDIMSQVNEKMRQLPTRKSPLDIDSESTDAQTYHETQKATDKFLKDICNDGVFSESKDTENAFINRIVEICRKCFQGPIASIIDMYDKSMLSSVFTTDRLVMSMMPSLHTWLRRTTEIFGQTKPRSIYTEESTEDPNIQLDINAWNLEFQRSFSDINVEAVKVIHEQMTDSMPTGWMGLRDILMHNIQLLNVLDYGHIRPGNEWDNGVFMGILGIRGSPNEIRTTSVLQSKWTQSVFGCLMSLMTRRALYAVMHNRQRSSENQWSRASVWFDHFMHKDSNTNITHVLLALYDAYARNDRSISDAGRFGEASAQHLAHSNGQRKIIIKSEMSAERVSYIIRPKYTQIGDGTDVYSQNDTFVESDPLVVRFRRLVLLGSFISGELLDKYNMHMDISDNDMDQTYIEFMSHVVTLVQSYEQAETKWRLLVQKHGLALDKTRLEKETSKKNAELHRIKQKRINWNDKIRTIESQYGATGQPAGYSIGGGSTNSQEYSTLGEWLIANNMRARLRDETVAGITLAMNALKSYDARFSRYFNVTLGAADEDVAHYEYTAGRLIDDDELRPQFAALVAYMMNINAFTSQQRHVGSVNGASMSRLSRDMQIRSIIGKIASRHSKS